MKCLHLGKSDGVCVTATGTKHLYRCGHSDHRIVDQEQCLSCIDFVERHVEKQPLLLRKQRKAVRSSQRLHLDVGTTALPRLLTVRGIGSFLDRFSDRHKYCLRWIFHLDYMDFLRDNWIDNLAQATALSVRFNDALILVSTTNQGFGGSMLNVLRHARNDMLWIEDDKLWVKSFRMARVQRACRDAFNFGRTGTRVGCTTPSFWRLHVVEYLRDWLAKQANIRRITERRIKHALHFEAGFQSNQNHAGLPIDPSRDMGKQQLYDAGFKKDFFGVKLEGHPEVVTC